MAIANLHETLLQYTVRKQQINQEIFAFRSQKSLALAMSSETQSILSYRKSEIRNQYKNIYDNDLALQDEYSSYTEMEDFEDAIDKITAEINDELAEIAAWEESIDAQITERNTELEEIKAEIESVKTMLSSNVQEDFNFGLNQ